MLKKLVLTLACCAPFVAGGQNGSVGRTAEVQGLVTVSEGNIVRTARNGAVVLDGSRVVTSSNGTVRIRLDNGCELVLTHNQSVIIDYTQDCPALIAMIQTLDGPSFAFLPARDVTNGLLFLMTAAWIWDGSPQGAPGTGPGDGGQLPDITPE